MRNDAPEPDIAPGEEAAVRETANPTQAGDWALVLAAAGLAYRLEAREGRFVLSVAAGDQAPAVAALAAFDAEAPAKPVPPAPDAGPSALGVLAALGLGAMFYVAGPADAHSRWIDAGAAVSQRIVAGQWWRAVTALTLHGDLQHLVWNVVACLIFVTAVGRWLGGGLGAIAILFTASVGNLATAAVHRTNFTSIGASTATFAALGLCAGLQVVRRLREGSRRAYAWLPLGAGLAFFMLALRQGVDTYAHLFGLGLGALVGSAAALGNVRAPRTTVQMLLAAAALGAVVSAWVLALHAVR
jgi:membrane associated rhomboid family serine protease